MPKTVDEDPDYEKDLKNLIEEELPPIYKGDYSKIVDKGDHH